MSEYKSLEQMAREFNQKKFSDKLKEMRLLSQSVASMTFRSRLSGLSMDGYIRIEQFNAVWFGEGENYVYLWKHRNGDVFYVGSGRGERYRSKNRNDQFLSEIDKADAIVYIVAKGLGEKESREIERFVSGSFSCGGFDLCNKDNRIKPKEKDKFYEWVDEIRKKYGEKIDALESHILKDVVGCNSTDIDDNEVINSFLNLYGNQWFTKDKHKESGVLGRAWFYEF